MLRYQIAHSAHLLLGFLTKIVTRRHKKMLGIVMDRRGSYKNNFNEVQPSKLKG
jgi:hypothetical protein